VSALSNPAFGSVMSGTSNDAIQSFMPLFCGTTECRTYMSVAIRYGLSQSAPASGVAALSISESQASQMMDCVCSHTSMFGTFLTSNIASQQSAIESNMVSFCASSACRAMVVFTNPDQVNSALIETACASVPAPTGGTEVTFATTVSGTFDSTAQTNYRTRLASYVGVSTDRVTITTSSSGRRNLDELVRKLEDATKQDASKQEASKQEASKQKDRRRLQDTTVTAVINTDSPAAAVTAAGQLSGITSTNSEAALGVTTSANPTVTTNTNAASYTAPAGTTLFQASGAGGGGGGGDNPCFDADTTLSCRTVPGATITALEAAALCFGGAVGTQASLVLMTSLSAGDEVLAYGGGRLSLDRVVVNQHKAGRASSPMLQITHTAGSLNLTPEHVLFVDGAFAAARTVLPGSSVTLATGEAATVLRVVAAPRATIINPMTASGTILAVADGEPIVAATHPEWISEYMLSGSAPLRLPLFHLLSYAAPDKLQAYYDAVVEPVFSAVVSPHAHVLSAYPLSFGAALLLADALSAIIFCVFTAPLALFVGVGGVLALRARKA